MANWKPADKSPVHWHMPGGEVLAETTTFADVGADQINTVAGFSARYANGKVPTKDGVKAHIWGQAEDHGILSAAMERAGKDKSNPWGLGPDDFKSYVTVLDFGATQIGSEGLAKSQIMKLYPASGEVGDWPVREGDSTNPRFRTERKIMGPYGNFEKVVGGKTYYYKNPRLNRPSDPWYLSPTESKTDKPVVSATMGQGGGSGSTTAAMTVPEIKTRINLLVADFSRDLPPQGEGGRHADKLRELLRQLKGLAG